MKKNTNILLIDRKFGLKFLARIFFQKILYSDTFVCPDNSVINIF